MKKALQEESLFVSLLGGVSLHLRHFKPKPSASKKFPPIFMLHGSIENGTIFYSKNKKGLAPYLASQGYEVYVGDLRGRGKSRPKISSGSQFGQTQTITQDLPAFIEFIHKRHGNQKQYWIAHSWGGVLLLSLLARFPKYASWVKGIVCFGTKRNINVQNLQKFFAIDLFWNKGAYALTKLFGYLPSKLLKIGSENESSGFHHEVKLWAQAGYPWVDPQDGFNYARAIKKVKLPPQLHLTGLNDAYLGNAKDVQAFIEECGSSNAQFKLLSRYNGNFHDYDHIDILTHPDAVKDHFPMVLDWLRKFK